MVGEVINIEEIWKDIEGYEGFYKVSNMGRVKNSNNHILKQQNRSGYARLLLCKNGTRKHFVVHRLVAAAFIENPEDKDEVNHIDFNKDNNKVSNLEWVTRQENIAHFLNSQESNTEIKKTCNKNQALIDNVLKIKEMLIIGKKTHADIADICNVSEATIYSIKSGRTRSNLTSDKIERLKQERIKINNIKIPTSIKNRETNRINNYIALVIKWHLKHTNKIHNQISKESNISRQTISSINNNKIWNNVYVF